MRTILFRTSVVGALAAWACYPQSVGTQAKKTQMSGYTVVDLGTLGGTFSIAFDVNDGGRVAGAATVPGEYQHATVWDRGQKMDLGTMGGLNSQGSGRAGRDEFGILSEIADDDPLAEDFCGFHTTRVCRAGVWQKGAISPLPSLGGRNAAILTGNNQGQYVGLAEDGVPDANCMPPQKSHFQAAAWEKGVITKLPPLPGDEVGMALRNNDRGQIIGTTGLCSNTIFGGFGLGPHAVLWDHGTPINLGHLGDPNNALAAAINNRGEVFGAARVPDGTLHGFRWTQPTGIQDLGLMSSDPADAVNTPFNVNDSGQMVGASCNEPFAVCRGYIWEDDEYTDLNTLIPADSPLYIMLPFSINQAGQITGLALDKNTFEAHAFLATPNGGKGAAKNANQVTNHMPVPESARKVLRKRLHAGQ